MLDGLLKCVDALAPVTAGARRINVLFDAMINGEAQGFCVTQLPNEGEAFRSIPDEVRWLRNAFAAARDASQVETAEGADPPAEPGDELVGAYLLRDVGQAVQRIVDGWRLPDELAGLVQQLQVVGQGLLAAEAVAHGLGHAGEGEVPDGPADDHDEQAIGAQDRGRRIALSRRATVSRS